MFEGVLDEICIVFVVDGKRWVEIGFGFVY